MGGHSDPCPLAVILPLKRDTRRSLRKPRDPGVAAGDAEGALDPRGGAALAAAPWGVPPVRGVASAAPRGPHP